MRGRWLVCLLATTLHAQDGEGGASGAGSRDAEEGRLTLLLKQVGDPDPLVRAKATRALRREKDDRAVAAARNALRDDDEAVRAAAAVALVRLGGTDEEVVGQLALSLRSADWYTRWDACVALGSLGPAASAAAPALLAAAADPSLDLSRDAVLAVARVKPTDPQVLKDLVRLLDSERDLDRKALLLVLKAAGQVALARDWLTRELIANRHGLRVVAAGLLPKCGVEGVDSLKEAASDPDPWVRCTAIYSLARQKEVGDAVFVQTLLDPARDMRRAALHALKERKYLTAAGKIAALLSDPEQDLRLAAARALEELNVVVPEAGPGLVRLLGEGDKDLAVAALDAMRRTGFAALAAFLECPLRSHVAGTPWTVRLRPRGGSEDLDKTLDHLIERLGDRKHGAALVAALRETLAPDEDLILVEKLASDHAELRRAAACLLGHLGRDRNLCLPALERAARDRHPEVRAAAAAAIERLRPPAR